MRNNCICRYIPRLPWRRLRRRSMTRLKEGGSDQTITALIIRHTSQARIVPSAIVRSSHVMTRPSAGNSRGGTAPCGTAQIACSYTGPQSSNSSIRRSTASVSPTPRMSVSTISSKQPKRSSGNPEKRLWWSVRLPMLENRSR